MDLHEELLTYTFASWHSYTIIHCMIDAGIVTKLECMATECKLPTREFLKQGPRGSGGLLVLDHIVPRRTRGSHQIGNLRIVHNSCNAGWRKGITGSFHTDETKAVLSAKMKQAHADGKFKKIYTPERGQKLSEAFTGRPLTDETKAKISTARRGQPSAFKGKTHSPETREKLRQAALKRRRSD